ncbi:MAG: hypothetical protein ABGZ17_08735, partial [Planctomycetaceae bacterium]
TRSLNRRNGTGGSPSRQRAHANECRVARCSHHDEPQLLGVPPETVIYDQSQCRIDSSLANWLRSFWHSGTHSGAVDEVTRDPPPSCHLRKVFVKLQIEQPITCL